MMGMRMVGNHATASSIVLPAVRVSRSAGYCRMVAEVAADLG
jgi:hypothetical protein